MTSADEFAGSNARVHPETDGGASTGVKTCPMCGATIEALARQCRFCGERLTGTDQPAGLGGIWRDGKWLVMSQDAELPFICIKTNQPASEWLRCKMYWHKPWVYLAILAGLLPYVILHPIVRQVADIRVGLCGQWARRRRWVIAGATFIASAGLVVIGIGFIVAAGNVLEGVLLIFAGIVWSIIAVASGSLLSRVVTPARIDKQHVWLKGVHPDFLKALPAFPGER